MMSVLLPASASDVQEDFSPPTLIFLHGIGNQTPAWFNEVLGALPASLSPRCVPFFWADLFDQSPAGKIAATIIKTLKTFTPVFAPVLAPNGRVNLQSLINASLQYIALPLLNQWLDKSADVLAYNSVRQIAYKRLQHLILEQKGNVILVAHSMGSVLAFEFLQEESPANVRVIRFISLGSPLDRQPIKRQVLRRTNGKTRLSCDWLNLWGALDLICCWQPWKSGELNSFFPKEQMRLAWQGHDLGSYLSHIPVHYLMDEDVKKM
jgi:pimeloyl-ACP methyl ester carboxylesterase